MRERERDGQIRTQVVDGACASKEEQEQGTKGEANQKGSKKKRGGGDKRAGKHRAQDMRVGDARWSQDTRKASYVQTIDKKWLVGWLVAFVVVIVVVVLGV